jgi:flagellar hook assembly protein FlgD
LGLFSALSNASTNVYVSSMSVHAPNTTLDNCHIAQAGDISDLGVDVSEPVSSGAAIWGQDAALIEFDRPGWRASTPLDLAGTISDDEYPGACLTLCATIKCTNLSDPLNPTGAAKTFPIESLRFEVFKMVSPGGSFLNDTAFPTLHTISMQQVGECTANSDNTPVKGGLLDGATEEGIFCAAWDGAYNIDGVTDWGKTNGNFGFRAIADVNWVTQTSGGIVLTAKAAYPGQDQYPVRMDVTNVHSLTTSPTIVGNITPVAAQPYNILFRSSKDAESMVEILTAGSDPDQAGTRTVLRVISNWEPVSGEGIPNGTLLNSKAWNGRDDAGNFLAPGDYTLAIRTRSADQWGGKNDASTTNLDTSQVKFRTLSLNPLQVTDIRVKGLGSGSADMAELTYILTEAASVRVEIYDTDTVFDDINVVPPEIGAVKARTTDKLVCGYAEKKSARQDVVTLWDGRYCATTYTGLNPGSARDLLVGQPVPDGNYVYAIYALMPSGATTIYTTRTYVGTIPVSRGFVVTTPLGVTSAAIGTSPNAGGLNPFQFQFSLSREAPVTLKIYDKTGQTVVKTIVSDKVRPANAVITEEWNGINEEGFAVAADTYLAELVVQDAFAPANEARVTTLFPIDLFRVVDLKIDPLLGNAGDQASVEFLLSREMNVTLTVYDPGSLVDSTSWPPTVTAAGGGAPTVTKVLFNNEPLAGRLVTTSFWDGLRTTTTDTMVADGNYPFVLTAVSAETVATYPDTDAGVDGYTDFDLDSTHYATDKTTGIIEVARGPVFMQNIAIKPAVIAECPGIELPPYTIEFEPTRIGLFTIDILSASCTTAGTPSYTIDGNCRRIIYRKVFPPEQVAQVLWDGRDEFGELLAAQDYTILITAEDYPTPALQTPTPFSTAIEFNPYRVCGVQITDINETNATGKLSYIPTESMKAAVQILRPQTKIDANGDTTQPIDDVLVKVLYGHRAGTLRVSELWDGTDRTGTPVADGNYVFRVVTSITDGAINNITGELTDWVNNVADADAYFTLQTINVSSGQSADICKAFEQTVNVFPNPIRTASATIRMTRLPTTGYYKFTLYDIAGYKVFERDWGYLVPSASYPNSEFTWNRTNQSGKRVARGVYFGLFELKNAFGGREKCQTVKKILIP